MMLTFAQVLDDTEVAWLRGQLESACWRDGADTAGSLSRGVKHNRQVDEGSQAAQSLGEFVLRKVSNHPEFISGALPKRIYPPRFNRYGVGETYGTHVDSAIMRIPGTAQTLRSDLSATLFLSGPAEYEGGVLEIDTAFGVQEVKLAAGSLVLYPASSLHRVTPIRSGERLASFFWIESLVRDPNLRAALFDLDQSIQALTAARTVDAGTLLRLSAVYHNLLRQHAES